MADWPTPQAAGPWESGGAVTSGATNGTTITADASANTKGAWTELIAATQWDASAVAVTVVNNSANNCGYALDLGIGAGGSEVVLIPDLFSAHGRTVYDTGQTVVLPVAVAKGSRVAARCQCSTGAATLTVVVQVMSAGWLHGRPSSRVTAYGVTTSGATAGVSVDAGSTANTRARAEIVASTTAPMRWMMISATARSAAGLNDGNYLFDVEVGASSSEVVVIPAVVSVASSLQDAVLQKWLGPFPVSIPAGTRIAVNAQNSANGAAGRVREIVIYGGD